MLLDFEGARKRADAFTIGQIDGDIAAIALLTVQAETLEYALRRSMTRTDLVKRLDRTRIEIAKLEAANAAE